MRIYYHLRLGKLMYLRWFGTAAACGPTYPTGIAGPDPDQIGGA